MEMSHYTRTKTIGSAMYDTMAVSVMDHAHARDQLGVGRHSALLTFLA